MSDSLWHHELQHARPLCPSPTPRVHPNPCPLSPWCHPTISSSVISFSSLPQSFPASVYFSCSVVSDSLWPHELQHPRPPCPSPTPRVHPNPCPLSPSSHLILCHPILLLPSIFPSIRFFSNESALHIRWPKYWSFSFNISPSNEHPGLISFRMDWLDLLAVQETLKSLLQHHSSKHLLAYHSLAYLLRASYLISWTYLGLHLCFSLTKVGPSGRTKGQETIKQAKGSFL